MGRFIFVSFGLLVVFLSLSGTGADCPPDWSSYEGSCYKLFIQKLKWDEAEQCSSNWSDGSCVCYENLVERRMKKCFVLEGREEPAGMNRSQHPPNGGHGCVPTLCPDLHPGRETGMAQIWEQLPVVLCVDALPEVHSGPGQQTISFRFCRSGAKLLNPTTGMAALFTQTLKKRW